VANTFLTTKEAGGLHFHIFETTSAAASETVTIGTGKQIVGGFVGYIGGTATAVTVSYVRATGVVTFGGLTATNNVLLWVVTD
jgi:hypothetical protein